MRASGAEADRRDEKGIGIHGKRVRSGAAGAEGMVAIHVRVDADGRSDAVSSHRGLSGLS